MNEGARKPQQQAKGRCSILR
jgi:hypothetical protein